jgi:hypothetical protein
MITVSFMKHDIKGALMCIGVEISTHYPAPTDHDIYLSNIPSQTVTDITAKSNSTVGVL